MHRTPLNLSSPLRRQWLLGSAAVGTALLSGLPLTAQALPPRQLQFPRDFGSHPDLRTEWWYITGLALAGGRRWGFQVTFFRSRVPATQGLRSAFAARQLIFAHAALTDLQAGRIAHDQRIARAGFGLAQASDTDTAVQLQDWSLVRSTQGTGSRYTAQVQANDFAFALQFDTTQPVLLQGNNGLSRKGPQAEQASYYYSQPQMQVSGRLQRGSERFVVEPASAPGDNRAWLDHEASDVLMNPQAVGWDWIGMNLHNGSALTAFRLRRADGSTLWAGGSMRPPGQAARIFGVEEVIFTPLRHWVSPLEGTRYPVQWRVATPSGTFEVRALLDNQELDSRASTGAVYWEGVCELRDSAGALRGHGYLEMTGYTQALRL
ncbi:lipocalin-like domain-containing protein [Simplicispira psychrophila]|uniref:lipocalin-like domain-containing protein n=1 Tax=Simplicispira psychrophila TaxID=80882 RepID=UPI00055CEFF1|nr:carotenoid 1,2-hydratase [Simplicispira psychrophila]